MSQDQTPQQAAPDQEPDVSRAGGSSASENESPALRGGDQESAAFTSVNVAALTVDQARERLGAVEDRLHTPSSYPERETDAAQARELEDRILATATGADLRAEMAAARERQ